MKLFFIIISILLYFQALSQNLPEIKKEGKKIFDFIPKDWDILGEAKGDLNKDNLEDVVVVIKNTDEDFNSDSVYKRILIVLIRNKDKTYSLSEISPNAILCKTCGGVMGDPFSSLEIKNNELMIGHYGGSNQRWSMTHTFKFTQNEWILQKEIIGTFESSNPDETYTEKIKSPIEFGKIKLRDFDIMKAANN